MKALCLVGSSQIELQNVPIPEKAEQGHYTDMCIGSTAYCSQPE
jgi:hypothetical protein